MRFVTLTAHVPGRDANSVYARIGNFASYPEHSEAVRSVVVTDVTGDVTLSQWEVSFRNGILRWTEEDTFDRAARRIDFTQLDGDVDQLAGTWLCEDVENGTRVTFTARVDLGIPTLADVLEPIAARALLDNTTSIIRGLFGADVVEESSSFGSGDLAVPASLAAPL